MTVTEKRAETAVELVVVGRLDTTTAPQLEMKVKESGKDMKLLILNLKDVSYISSAGLRVVLVAHKLMVGFGAKMVIKSPSDFCKQVFSATGMDAVLTIQP